MTNVITLPQLFVETKQTAPLPNNVLIFASGANRPEEIEGFAALGIPVGVSVQHLSEDAMQTLVHLRRPVMVDSGAFSEVRASSEGLQVVAPIGEDEWRRRLFQYQRLAASLGDLALLVVPDRVGCQFETLLRIERYRSELLVLAGYGAELLLPLQVGGLSHRDFYVRATAAAGIQMVPAMPMRKAATPIGQLLDFVKQVKPERMHLLGAGIENKRAAKLVRLLLMHDPQLRITMDSNRLRAVIGRNRPLTRLEGSLREADVTSVYGAVESTVLTNASRSLDYTDLIASPSLWAERGAIAEIAAGAGLNADETIRFLGDPDLFLQSKVSEDCDLAWIDYPPVSLALDSAWERFVARSVRSAVRKAAIVEVFAASRIANQLR
jgi:hypothetical protein